MTIPAVARLGDPISHGGQITGASTDVKANGIGVARFGDTVHCDVHGNQTISSASTTVNADGRGVARVGDSISCGAVITDGSPNVNSG